MNQSHPLKEQTAYAVSILKRISSGLRVDLSHDIAALSNLAQVSPEAFKAALEATRHSVKGEHVYFSRKTLKNVIEMDRRERAEAKLADLMKEAKAQAAALGKTLQEVIAPNKAEPTTTITDKPSFRIMPDEREWVKANLVLTGKPNISAQVKECINAYPRYLALLHSHDLMKADLTRLQTVVESLPGMVLSLTAATLEAQSNNKN